MSPAAATPTAADLDRIDARCQEIAGELGFAVPPIVFHVMGSAEVYDIAARGLPGRYSSSRFGASFRRQHDEYRLGRSRIYELIVNTDPVHAYLLDGNSRVAQTLVMAHCIGHAWFFAHNGWFGPTDRAILPRVRGAAERIDGYMAAHGRDRVEDFVEACEAIVVHQPQAQLVHAADPEPEEDRPGPYDALFPDDVTARRDRIERAREDRVHRVPLRPDRDLLGFIEHHATGLAEWQRDVISILRSEQAYFLPQMRTKILNEGLAVLCHQEICQRLMLPAEDYWQYEQLNASVTQPHLGAVNPYHLGSTILREVMRIAQDPDDEERERWPWAGEVDPLEQVRAVCRDHDDESLLREHLTPKVCERARLFAFEHVQGNPRQIRVSSTECDEIRERLIAQHATFGVPHVEVVDADHGGRGELYLRHRDEVGLDPEYARGTLLQVATLWGRPAIVETTRHGDPIWYVAGPDGHTEDATERP
ncbi:SpoVR family protein [Patulibacter sp. NPDC049589]|uniref:SpoVR family protein n=1 Tax=Patulibacter sp. NPDC049589 TaxID=3154731 RepID=UPI003412198A